MQHRARVAQQQDHGHLRKVRADSADHHQAAHVFDEPPSNHDPLVLRAHPPIADAAFEDRSGGLEKFGSIVVRPQILPCRKSSGLRHAPVVERFVDRAEVVVIVDEVAQLRRATALHAADKHRIAVMPA